VNAAVIGQFSLTGTVREIVTNSKLYNFPNGVYVSNLRFILFGNHIADSRLTRK